MANSVDPDETAQFEPSHLYLYCLQRYMFWCAGLKGYTEKEKQSCLYAVISSFDKQLH